MSEGRPARSTACGDAPALSTRILPALLTIYHRVDDPWSYLLLQCLPRLAARYDLRFRFVTVPLADESYVPRPHLLMANALRDCRDLVRHLDLAFPDAPASPTPAQVAMASAALLMQQDPDSYLTLALGLGAALFSGGGEGVQLLCKSIACFDQATMQSALEQNLRHEISQGHYHSAMIAFDGGWYWGIDRLYHLEQALIARGYRRPTGVAGALSYREQPDIPVVRPARAADGRALVRFYCSFRSPYAYIAAPRVFDLARRYDAAIDARLIIPMKMAGFAIPPIKAAYFRMDCAREGLRHGIPFGHFTDPYGTGLKHAMSLVPAAQRRGALHAYILSVMRGTWADGLDTADDGDLRKMADRAGLVWSEDASLLSDDPDLSWADRHRQELAELGQYAAPVFVVGDYVTWGQDRLWMLERVLRKVLSEPEGAARRPG